MFGSIASHSLKENLSCNSGMRGTFTISNGGFSIVKKKLTVNEKSLFQEQAKSEGKISFVTLCCPHADNLQIYKTYMVEKILEISFFSCIKRSQYEEEKSDIICLNLNNKYQKGK